MNNGDTHHGGLKEPSVESSNLPTAGLHQGGKTSHGQAENIQEEFQDKKVRGDRLFHLNALKP